MMYDTDIMLILKRLDAFEEDLKKLENEIREMKPKYHPWQSDEPAAPYYRPIYTTYALSKGNLMDAGVLQQWSKAKPVSSECKYVDSNGKQWRVATENEDIEE